MKKFLVISFLLIVNTLYSEDYPKYYWVTSKSGLILREHPDEKSNKKLVIPFEAKIIRLNADFKNATVNGINGKWIYVNWQKYQSYQIHESNSGWVFDAFLKDINKMRNDNIEFINIIQAKGLKFKSLEQFNSGDAGCAWLYESNFNFNFDNMTLTLCNSYDTINGLDILSIYKTTNDYNIKINKENRFGEVIFKIIFEKDSLYITHNSRYLIQGFPAHYVPGEAKDLIGIECVKDEE